MLSVVPAGVVSVSVRLLGRDATVPTQVSTGAHAKEGVERGDEEDTTPLHISVSRQAGAITGTEPETVPPHVSVSSHTGDGAGAMSVYSLCSTSAR